MLGAWKESGWPALFGRAPTDDDPIVPKAPGRWIDEPGTPHFRPTNRDDGAPLFRCVSPVVATALQRTRIREVEICGGHAVELLTAEPVLAKQAVELLAQALEALAQNPS